jgi:hypothetical protein
LCALCTLTLSNRSVLSNLLNLSYTPCAHLLYGPGLHGMVVYPVLWCWIVGSMVQSCGHLRYSLEDSMVTPGWLLDNMGWVVSCLVSGVPL